jgi:hypothetical protein
MSTQGDTDNVSCLMNSQNHMIHKLKSILLLLKISIDLENGIELIKHNFKLFISAVSTKRGLITKSIIEQRRKSAIFLQSHMRVFKIRKSVRNVLKRLETNFCLISMVRNVHKLALKIYLSNGKTQSYDFEFCNIRETYVLYFPKELTTKSSIKVNFIADGQVFIDPNHKTEYDGSSFYNLIEFKKFIELEREKEEFVQFMVKQMKYESMTKDRCASSSDDDDTDDANVPTRSKVRNLTTSFQGRNSISFNSPVNIRWSATFSGRKDKRVNTVSNLHMPKPILKSPTSQASLNKLKKVSFTNILTYDY